MAKGVTHARSTRTEMPREVAVASIARLPSSTDDPRASGSTADRHGRAAVMPGASVAPSPAGETVEHPTHRPRDAAPSCRPPVTGGRVANALADWRWPTSSAKGLALLPQGRAWGSAPTGDGGAEHTTFGPHNPNWLEANPEGMLERDDTLGRVAASLTASLPAGFQPSPPPTAP